MALMPVADALAAVLSGAEPLPEEAVALDDAFHRTLARDVAALRTQPPAAMSAMDGYAVRAADATLDARLKVIGEVAAGRPFDGTLGAGQAARIFTGGVIPSGADAVVIQEDTARDGDTVVIAEAARQGAHIRAAGLDFREGEVLLRHGTRLTDRDLSLAAAMNHPRLPVHRRRGHPGERRWRWGRRSAGGLRWKARRAPPWRGSRPRRRHRPKAAGRARSRRGRALRCRARRRGAMAQSGREQGASQRLRSSRRRW